MIKVICGIARLIKRLQSKHVNCSNRMYDHFARIIDINNGSQHDTADLVNK